MLGYSTYRCSFPLSFSFRLCGSNFLDFTHSKVGAFGDTQVTLSDPFEHPEQVNSATQVYSGKAYSAKALSFSIGFPEVYSDYK